MEKVLFGYAFLKIKNKFVHFICNFIWSKQLRIKTRVVLREKFNLDMEKVLSLEQIDHFIPSLVLNQINQVDNEYFLKKNKEFALNPQASLMGGGI